MKRPGTIECNQPKREDEASFDQLSAAESFSYCHGTSLADLEKVTIKEAAKLIGCSDSSVRKRINLGDLPYISVGSKIMILKRDIELYLSRQYQKNSPADTEFEPIPTLPKEVLSSPYLMRAG